MFALYILGAVLLAGFMANIQAWARAFASLFFSQSRHLKRTLKMNEGAPLTALGAEVSMMTDMIKVNTSIFYFGVGMYLRVVFLVFGCIYKTTKSTSWNCGRTGHL